MTVLLLANMGNHDLKLTDRNLLPTQDDPRYYGPRRLGEEVCSNFARYRDAIELPLIGATVQWLEDSGVNVKEDLAIHLFASNQDLNITPQSEWLKDTYPAAQVAREFLHHKWQIPKKCVFLHQIEGIPADYTNMLSFFQRVLPEIQKKAQAERVYLEVSGGTPAMTSMLILMGVEVFGQDVVTLYLDREESSPHEIGVARALFSRKARQALLQQVRLYSYHVALATLAESDGLIHPDERKRALLGHLLGYADRRLALDYNAARAHLREARALAVGNLQALIGRWQAELGQPQNDVKLAELIHSAAIKLHLGDYADFTQRLFRFQEALFRHMAERMGVEYGKDEKYLSTSWRKANPALDDFLKRYGRAADGQPAQEPTAVDTSGRSLNRYSLGAIVDFFIQQPEWAHWKTAAEQNFRFSTVADLRNKGISGHGFEGISRGDIEEKYGADPEAILTAMRGIYAQVFDREPAASPYDLLNDQVENLLKELL